MEADGDSNSTLAPQSFTCSIDLTDACRSGKNAANSPYVLLVELLNEPGFKVCLWNDKECFCGELKGDELNDLVERNDDYSWEDYFSETRTAFTGRRDITSQIIYRVLGENKIKSSKSVLILSWWKKEAAEKEIEMGSIVLLRKTDCSSDIILKAMKMTLAYSVELNSKRKTLSESLTRENSSFLEARDEAEQIGPVKQQEYTKIVSVAALLLDSKNKYRSHLEEKDSEMD